MTDARGHPPSGRRAQRAFGCSGLLAALVLSGLLGVAMVWLVGSWMVLGFREAVRHPEPPDVLPSATAVAAHDAAWKEWTLRRETVPLRDVLLRVVCDQKFRGDYGEKWRDDARARIERASHVFEREFRIRLVPTSIDEWQSADDAGTLEVVLQALAVSSINDSADAVIGFTSQAGLYDRGKACYYGRCCVVRTDPRVNPWPYEDETVLHEVAHLFGAWHAVDQTVMRGQKWGAATSNFDPFARAAILATRTLDFRRGLDSLSDETLGLLHAEWRQSHPGEAGFPPFEASCTEAGIAQRSGDLDRARARCRLALSIDSRFGPFHRRWDDAEILAWAESSGDR